MRDPAEPKAYYEGPLKDLATSLASLIGSVLWLLLAGGFIWLTFILYWSGLYGWSVVFVDLKILHFGGVICAWGYMAYASIRMGRLLFPHVCGPFSFVAVLPLTTLPCALFLWIYAVRQLRARGVRAGLFGIDPARVD